MGLMLKLFMTQSLMKKMLALLASIFFVGGGFVMAQSSTPAQELAEAKKLLSDRPQEALTILKRILQQNQMDAEVWYSAGVAYVELGDFKKAQGAFEHATTIDPKFGEARTALAYTYLRRGKLKQGMIAANAALSIQPNSADAHYTLGLILYRTGDRSEALTHAEATIKSKPTFAEAYLLKSQSLVASYANAIVQNELESKQSHNMRYEQAVEALDAYLKLVPKSEDRDFWKAQVESLRFYSDASQQQDVYAGKEVTTKARLLAKPEPQYSDAARDGAVEGTVVLKAVFASDGTVKHILIIQSLPEGLTEACVNAARRIRFVPATRDGKPVSMWMQLEYNFSLH